MPLTAVFHPLGFRLELATNSRDVLEAADEVWGLCRAEFTREAVRLRIVVQPTGNLASEPVFRAQNPLFSVVSDQHNFGVADAASLSGFCMITAATASHHALLRWNFLESMVYLLLAQRYVVPVHAACVARAGSGVLLCGPSSAGKSTLAYACARAGWTYLCDDATFLQLGSDGRVALGKPYQVRFREDAPSLFPELAGHIVKLRPNGRLAIEVPTAALPEIQTSTRCRIEHMVFLDRRANVRPAAQPLDSIAAIESLLDDMPSYGSDVNKVHESTLRRLERVPAWQLTYEHVEEGIALLSQLVRT